MLKKIWVATLLVAAMTFGPAIAQATEMVVVSHHHRHHHSLMVHHQMIMHHHKHM
jgi:hypothetical protein